MKLEYLLDEIEALIPDHFAHLRARQWLFKEHEQWTKDYVIELVSKAWRNIEEVEKE